MPPIPIERMTGIGDDHHREQADRRPSCRTRSPSGLRGSSSRPRPTRRPGRAVAPRGSGRSSAARSRSPRRGPTSATRNWTMIETLVMYVSTQISVKVFRIDATATRSGIDTAGSVPNTNSRMTRAPTPPIKRLGQHAGPARRAALRVVEGVASGHVRLYARRGSRLERGADVLEARVRAEARPAGRIEGRERRVPVARNVGEASGGEVGRGAKRRELLRDPRQRLAGRRALRHVTLDAHHGDVRGLRSRAEDVKRPLVGLVGREAWNRKLLQPALRNLLRAKRLRRS